jgi:predicted nucleic acid-binding Zn ribbon protein
MPIYSYQCESFIEVIPEGKTLPVSRHPCDHKFEVFYRSIGEAERDERSETCPSCGGKNKTKLISQGTSHILKGKGWYRDGY